jgi:hypothetical protein
MFADMLRIARISRADTREKPLLVFALNVAESSSCRVAMSPVIV